MHNLSYRPMSSSDASALHKIASDWSVVRQLGGWPWPARHSSLGGASRMRVMAAFSGLSVVMEHYADLLQSPLVI